MNMYDIILKKKRNIILSKEEIEFVVNGYTNGTIPDYQMSAFLMAVCFNGMNEEETFYLTIAMRDSGDILDLSRINGIKVDKHSTGGVGDKVSLILAPILAALDVKVAKMSGKGLGHTGGTIDKLESIPGLNTNLSEDKFFENVNNIGVAIAGQTANLAPADKKIYALRDVTATVDCIPLIASSVMSKKLASGADSIVLDVKCGNGAFMKDEEEAYKLAEAMVDIGKKAGKNIAAIITDMNQPLGNYIGNSLEIVEVILALQGKIDNDLMDVVYALGSEMLVFAKKTSNTDEAKRMMVDVINNNKAYEKFIEFVKAQDGDVEYVYHPEKLVDTKIMYELKSEQSGFVVGFDTEGIGRGVQVLGGGRLTKEDIIDYTVGIVVHKKIADAVKKGDILATIYANDEKKFEAALNYIKNSIFIKGENIMSPNIIKKVI